MLACRILAVLADVDDLKKGRGKEYVDVSHSILVFVSAGYFQSPNCMRELLGTVLASLPVVTLLEPEAKHGGLTSEQVLAQLEENEATDWYERCGLADEVREWGYTVPSATTLHAALFPKEEEIIEWNRIGFFQDVSMRLIANCALGTCLAKCSGSDSSSMIPIGGGSDRSVVPKLPIGNDLLPEMLARMLQKTGEVTVQGSYRLNPEATFLQGEVSIDRPQLNPPRDGNSFHVYCSSQNPGARALMLEVGRKLTWENLQLACELEQMMACDCMLVYLTSRTWTRGEQSVAFGAESAEPSPHHGLCDKGC